MATRNYKCLSGNIIDVVTLNNIYDMGNEGKIAPGIFLYLLYGSLRETLMKSVRATINGKEKLDPQVKADLSKSLQDMLHNPDELPNFDDQILVTHISKIVKMHPANSMRGIHDDSKWLGEFMKYYQTIAIKLKELDTAKGLADNTGYGIAALSIMYKACMNVQKTYLEDLKKTSEFINLPENEKDYSQEQKTIISKNINTVKEAVRKHTLAYPMMAKDFNSTMDITIEAIDKAIAQYKA